MIGREPGIEASHWSRAFSGNIQREYPYNRESVPINEFWADSFRWRMSYLHRESGCPVDFQCMLNGCQVDVNRVDEIT